jgi:hypothetical protein
VARQWPHGGGKGAPQGAFLFGQGAGTAGHDPMLLQGKPGGINAFAPGKAL